MTNYNQQLSYNNEEIQSMLNLIVSKTFVETCTCTIVNNSFGEDYSLCYVNSSFEYEYTPTASGTITMVKGTILHWDGDKSDVTLTGSVTDLTVTSSCVLGHATGDFTLTIN